MYEAIICFILEDIVFKRFFKRSMEALSSYITCKTTVVLHVFIWLHWRQFHEYDSFLDINVRESLLNFFVLFVCLFFWRKTEQF